MEAPLALVRSHQKVFTESLAGGNGEHGLDKGTGCTPNSTYANRHSVPPEVLALVQMP